MKDVLGFGVGQEDVANGLESKLTMKKNNNRRNVAVATDYGTKVVRGIR